MAVAKVVGGTLKVYNSYNIKDDLKKAGYRYDPNYQFWYKVLSPDVSHISAWEKEFELLSSLGANVDELKTLISRLRAELKDGIKEVPAPKGLSYRNFQLEFILKAVRSRARILADEMGLGKTVQSIGVINATGARRVIVFCPAFLRLNWKKELERWLMEDVPVYVIKGGKDVDLVLKDEGVFVVSYDLSSKLPPASYDLLIADEAHYLKNPHAQRTYHTLKTKADRFLFLTGTPILNRPTEIVPVLAKIESEWIFDQDFESYRKAINKFYWNFAYKYCHVEKDEWGTKVKGVKNAEALKLLLAQHMDRRTKKDVLKELPNKIRSVLLLDAEEVQDLLNKERELLLLSRRGKKREDVVFSDVPTVQGKTLEEVTSQLENYVQLKLDGEDNSGLLFLLKHLIELKKIKPSVELAQNLLEEQDRLVVFTWHKDVAEFIARELQSVAKTFLVTSDVDIKKRQAYVEEFQSDSEEKMVFVSTIKAGGVGLTLTRASTAIFVGLSYVPADLLQAEDRLHRIGQEVPVNLYYVIFSGSVDEAVLNAVERKQDDINKITGEDDRFDYALLTM